MEIEPIDRVVVNGRIVTMRAPGEAFEAMAVAGGRVVALGSTAEIRGHAPRARVVDCQGRLVLPGFNDGHCHPDMLGARLGRWVDLSEGPTTLDGVLELVRARVVGMAPSQWFVAYGFDDLRVGGYPTRAALDHAAGGRPAFLYRRDGHLGFANTAALGLVGFGRDAQDPPFGRVDRDPRTGEPTGLLREAAALDVLAICQKDFTVDDFAQGLEKVFATYARHGVTSVHNSLCSRQGLIAYQRMREAASLRMRVGVLVSGRDDDLVDAFIRSGLRSGFGDDLLRVIGIEWCPDCSTSGRTAAYYEPYVGEKVLGEPDDNRGMLLYEAQDFKRRVSRAHEAGFMVAADGVGDRGIDFVLDAFEHALERHPRADHRMRVEHCCNVTPAILERLKRLGVICSSATGFAYDLGDAYLRNRGFDAMKRMWPHRAMIDAGVIAPGHSDSPICHPNPMRGVHSMVNRVSASGADLDRSQAVSVYEAVQAYTTLGAYAGREETAKGDLSPGKLADFVIMEDDIFAMPAERLAGARVAATYLGGDEIYRRDD